jgi:hypothetical protein
LCTVQATQSSFRQQPLAERPGNAGTHPDAVNLPSQGSSEAVALRVLVSPSFSVDQMSTCGFFAVNEAEAEAAAAAALYRVSGKIGE